MKKPLLIMGICACCLSSLEASGFHISRSPKKPIATPPPPQAPVLTPPPPSPTVPPAKPPLPSAAENITTYWVSPNPETLSFTLGISYLGGYYGPSETTIAQDGVYTTPSPSNPQKNFVSVNLSWSNGVGISLVYNSPTGHSVRLFYDFLTNKSNTSPVFTAPTTYTNAASTLVLGGNSAGTAGQITAANATYQLVGRNRAALETLHLIYSTPSLKVLGSVGGLAGYLQHEAQYALTELFSGNQSQNTQNENMVHGGPTGTLLVAKYCGVGLAFYGMFRFTAHAASVQFTSQAESYTGTTNNGFNVNTKGTLNRLFSEEEVCLGFSWNHQFSEKFLYTFTADWTGGFTSNSTGLFSSTSGTQAIKSQNIIYGLLRANFNFTF